jgi:hypothetical protein
LKKNNVLRKFLFFSCLYGILFPISHAAASPGAGKFGLGIAFFDPTGLSVKYKFSEKKSVSGAIGWNRHGASLFAQYHFDEIQLVPKEGVDLAFTYGLGARLVTHERKDSNYKYYRDRLFGVRMSAGLNYVTPKVPIEIFFELAPVLVVVPETFFELDAVLGVRYFF